MARMIATIVIIVISHRTESPSQIIRLRKQQIEVSVPPYQYVDVRSAVNDFQSYIYLAYYIDDHGQEGRKGMVWYGMVWTSSNRSTSNEKKRL